MDFCFNVVAQQSFGAEGAEATCDKSDRKCEDARLVTVEIKRVECRARHV